MQILAGLALAGAISSVAYIAGSLTRSGAVAATCVGALVFGLGGWQWAVLLLSFFATSSVFSQGLRKPQRAQEKYAKGSRRDAGQVLGNGGVAATWVLVHAAFPESALPWLGFSGALAAVTADTWATEIGPLSRAAPHLITRIRLQVEAGTSGGISPLGILAGAAGGGFIAAIAMTLGPIRSIWILPVVLFAGFCGSTLDSVLGATLQCIYLCPSDGAETEQHPLHSCGSPTVHLRGWPWLNNDWVNGLCGALGSVLSFALAVMLGA
jgi:uncharacterized protein (TIGR00297 family)